MAEMALQRLQEKVGGLQFGRRERLTSAALRKKVDELITKAQAADASLVCACGEVGICLCTLKRW